MLRLLVLPATVLALSVAPAFAQDAPEGAYRDLWCGTAFGIATQNMVTQAPIVEADLAAAKAAGDKATEEQMQLIAEADWRDGLVTDGAALIEKASAAYKTAGFTEESFGKVKTDLEPKVTEQVIAGTTDPEFAFEDCDALRPGGGTPAPAN